MINLFLTTFTGLTLSRKEAALAKGRARKKLNELERLLEVVVVDLLTRAEVHFRVDEQVMGAVFHLQK